MSYKTSEQKQKFLSIRKANIIIEDEKENFQKWLGFIIFTNKEVKNIELISNYFFDNFQASPEKFYAFLQFFIKTLRSTKDKVLQKHLASQYLDILAVLCQRFNFFEERTTLEDYCFKISDPVRHKRISMMLMKYKKESKTHIKNILEVLHTSLSKKKYKFDLKGRYKNIYSVYKKIVSDNHKTVLNLKDIFAFRIILLNSGAGGCFEVMNFLHDRFTPVPDFFKDYISIPKINGYQSLHTGLADLIPCLDLPIEVQIRTKNMDHFAESGLAAHWLYSQEKKSQVITEREKIILKYFHDFAQEERKHRQIYCFSYDGNVTKVPESFSVLDFAYRIHTEVGHCAKKAQVNGKFVELNYKIQEGDQIKIIKSRRQEVCAEWMGFAQGQHALKKIFEYLKRYEQKIKASTKQGKIHQI